MRTFEKNTANLKSILVTIFFLASAETAFSQILVPTIGVGGVRTIATAPSLSNTVYLQVAAHEDDDILFMNPDIQKQITVGFGSVTIYLTAGQAEGASQLNRQEFAAARQHGIMAAYAQMAAVRNDWTRAWLKPDGVHIIEVYTLKAAPRIRLLFMNLPDGGDEIPPHNYALYHMFAESAYTTDTISPLCDLKVRNIIEVNDPANLTACDDQANNPVPVQIYNRAGIVATLSVLIESYNPTVIRTLDPQPFELLASDGGYIVSYDNSDHTFTARFVDEVLATVHRLTGFQSYTIIHYKGYSADEYPHGLGAADYNAKRGPAETYKPYDPNYILGHYDRYYGTVWERYPGSTRWLERTNDGRLVAVSVENRSIMMRYENTPGGPWVGPVRIWDGSPISPHLTLLKRPDGLLQIFALRLPIERERSPDPTAPPQDVVTAVQLSGSIAFGPWQSVGSPDTGTFVGVPTAAIDGTGQVFVFAKNSQGMASYTHFSQGAWSSWTTLLPQPSPYMNLDIIDGIAAITRDDGRVEVFATSRDGRIQHYVQDQIQLQTKAALFSTIGAKPRLSFSFAVDTSFSTTFSGAASAPTVTKNQDGRLEIFYREQGTGRVLTAYTTTTGTWAGPVLLYGDSGAGPVAAIRRDNSGEIVLFERNVWSGISTTRQTAPNSVFMLQWQILGGYLNEYPAAATDAFGRVVVAVKGGDGQVYIRRESSDSVGNFDAWTAIP